MGGRFQRRGAVIALLTAAAMTAPASAEPNLQEPLTAPAGGWPNVDPAIVTNPSWITRPTPRRPRATVREGRVDLDCISQPTGEVTDCAITYEGPSNIGLGAGVLATLGSARMAPRTVDGSPEASPIRFAVRFASREAPPFVYSPVPPAPQGEVQPIVDPRWARQISPDYPAAAISRRITGGDVVLNCGFISSGDLVDCSVLEETPSGFGFGQEALIASARARIAPDLVAAAPRGTRVQFHVRYAAQ